MMMLFRSLALLTLTAGLIITVALPASAQRSEPRLLSSHRDWNVYVFAEAGNQVCYMASQPSRSQGDYTRRGEVFAQITHRPAEQTFDTFSMVAGYTYKKGSEVDLRIGNRRFSLFTHGDTAWAEDAATDARIADAIKAGNSMVLRGTSSRGTLTTDTFSLSGSTAAYNAMSEACGVRR